MTTVSQAVEKRQEGPVTIMWSRRAHFAAVLPASVDVEAFLGTAAGALYGNRDLMDAARSNPDSLIVVLMRCAALGHLPGTDEFYIYNRKRKGRPEVAGTEGYRGIIERMYRSGAVAKVVVREVCARDYFRYSEGDDERPAHRFAARQGHRARRAPGTAGGDRGAGAGHRRRGDSGGDRGGAAGPFPAGLNVTWHGPRPPGPAAAAVLAGTGRRLAGAAGGGPGGAGQ